MVDNYICTCFTRSEGNSCHFSKVHVCQHQQSACMPTSAKCMYANISKVHVCQHQQSTCMPPSKREDLRPHINLTRERLYFLFNYLDAIHVRWKLIKLWALFWMYSVHQRVEDCHKNVLMSEPRVKCKLCDFISSGRRSLFSDDLNSKTTSINEKENYISNKDWDKLYQLNVLNFIHYHVLIKHLVL